MAQAKIQRADMALATGTGSSVFSASPAFTGIPTGIVALKNATTEVSTSAATAPTTGQVLTATSGSAASWQTPAVTTTNTLHPFLLLGA